MAICCAKCGSERVVPRAEVWDRTDINTGGGGKLYAYVYAKPDAIFFPETTYATLHARICGDCGYTEIYADGAAELYEAYACSRQAGAATVEPEPVPEGACLSCGKTIPPAAKACPACGWTWEAQAT